MLNLETRMDVLGVTVFQDADDPTRFYHLPVPPHITVEGGQPLFDLFTYRKGGTAGTDVAGGFLNMAVDTGLGSLKPRLEARLKERYGNGVTLASVPYTRGTARVIALGEQSDPGSSSTEPGGTTPTASAATGVRFIERILGAGQPSLDGDNRAIFSFSLTEDGAAFMLGVLNGNVNARPVGVIYTLEYVGLLPAYDLEITIDFKSSYEYTRQRFTLGTLLFRADVDNVIEALKQNQSIKIRETSRTIALSDPQAVRERQTRIDALVKDLATGALFQPSLTPGEPRIRGDTITAADPSTTAPTPAGSPVTAALQHGPSAAVAAGTSAMLARGEPATDPEGSATTPASGAASGNPATGATGASGTNPPGTPARTAADVWNQLGRPQAAFVLRNIRQDEQRSVTYSLTQTTAQAQTIAPQNFIQFLAAEHDLRSHVHIVDLNHPFFARININLNAQGVDFAAEGVVQMTVQVRYGTRPDGTAPKDTAEVILRGTSDSKDLTFFADARGTQWYEYKLTVDYRANFSLGIPETRAESDWIRTETRSLSVHPAWLRRVMPLTLQLAPNVPPDVSEVHTVVRYVNAARHVDESTQVILNAQQRSRTLHLSPERPDDPYEVTSTVFYTDGARDALPTLRHPDATRGGADDVLVLDVPRDGFLSGDVIMLDPLGELQSVVVDTEVRQAGRLLEARSVELSTPGKRETFSVRLPENDKAPEVRYRERRLFRDGGLETNDWQQPASPNIIVGIPAQGVMSVAVRYLGPPPSQLGLNGVLLDLTYRDPAGDRAFDQDDALLITDDPSTFTQDWKVRLPDRNARTYQWKLTLLLQDGTESSGPAHQDTRDQLILRLPPR